MDITQSHGAMAALNFGSAEQKYDRGSPQLNAGGRVELSPADGEVLARVGARGVVQYVSTLEDSEDLALMIRQMAKRECYFRLFDFTVTVTESRVFWEQEKLERPGVRMAGHIRYPWIRSVGYRPKQSFLNDPLIEIEFAQDLPVASMGTWYHTIELLFTKGFDPGDLSQLIATQAARHHLKHGCPEPVRQEVEAMATAPRLAPPPKNELATYVMPVFAMYPDCVDYIGDDRPFGKWLYKGVDENS